MKRIISLLLSALIFTAAGCHRDSSNEAPDRSAGRHQGIPEMQEGKTKTASPTDKQVVLDDRTSSVRLPQPAAGEKEMAASPVALEAARFAGDAHAPVFPTVSLSRESYNAETEAGFHNSHHSPLSTFSVDVDTASYANIRRFLHSGGLPPAGAVRIEEMINYFHYDYPQPDAAPFSLSAEVGPSPFHEDFHLVSIGLQGKTSIDADLPPSNLVFLIDVSGSMQSPDKLPLLQKAMKMLIDELDQRDRVAIVVYAGSDRVVLPPTAGSEKKVLYEAVESLHSGGSTHGSRGILTAYRLARQSFMPKGNNRIILASDGDFNVGITSRGELQRLIEEKRKSNIFLSVLGFGTGNYHDDTMELLANKGNGNYAYIDSLLEAKKVLVRQRQATLFTLAKDVKIQVEFNPAAVGAYRLIGYSNRLLETEDFNDDGKDAGEIGLGHQVTALYEIIPTGHEAVPEVDDLKYRRERSQAKAPSSELLTVKVRYKNPHVENSELMQTAVEEQGASLASTSDNFRMAAAVAGWGMHLSSSAFVGRATMKELIELARGARGSDPHGLRAECVQLMEMSELLRR